MRRIGGALALAMVVLSLAAPGPATAEDDPGELRLLRTEQPSPRIQVLSLVTPALEGPTNVRVLLPDDFDPSGTTRYPVLYILHGATQDSSRWLQLGDVEATTEGVPLIVVMPDGGPFGFYTDWWGHGAGGPRWETYHLDQLIPWIDARYPTVAARDGRAIAGESMGGLGALHYAAKRPDLFTAAASFSGAVDTNHLLAPPIIELVVAADSRHLPAAAFGPRLTEEVRYRGHNPVDLAENLRGLLLHLYSGDGSVGGPLGAVGIQSDPVEAVMHQMGSTMHGRLDALGIAHGWHDFPGCHCWPDWTRDLRDLVPLLMTRFAHPVAAPSPFSYRSIDASYGVYGWDVDIERPAVEFSRLFDAGPSGFGLTGSGTAEVTTAPLFSPGAPVAVTLDDATGTTTSTLAADDEGRLTVAVSLGPANPVQQYSIAGHLLALTEGGRWPATTATARFAPARPTAPASPSSSAAPTVAGDTDSTSAPAGDVAAQPAAAGPVDRVAPTTLAATGGSTAPRLGAATALAVLALATATARRRTERRGRACADALSRRHGRPS